MVLIRKSNQLTISQQLYGGTKSNEKCILQKSNTAYGIKTSATLYWLKNHHAISIDKKANRQVFAFKQN